MEISVTRCKTILDTLPIGYYAGRRIETTLDEKEDTSFYSPVEDKIVVSYPIIAKRCKGMPKASTCTEEEAVRSMLYHEVSHAILTPQNMEMNFQRNVFEDERIETVLSDYYHEVDFRKQLLDIHDGHAPAAVDAKSAFFNAVRFGLGTPEIKAEVERMLEKYASINRLSETFSNGCGVYDYTQDIEDLWREINKSFAKDPIPFQPQSGEGKPQNSDSDVKTIKTLQDENPQSGGASHHGTLSAERIKEIMQTSLNKNNNLTAREKKKIAEFQKTAELIIGNFNKKNKGGSGINAYSGVFNPRAVVRKDYRYFEKSMTTQGNNKFGTCHLNLIIDASGSFCSNENLVNGILMALTEIERKNRNFSLDVAFVNYEFHLCESIRERHLNTQGGNDLPKNLKEIMMKLQKPNTCNYTIVLFDGDALSGHRSTGDESKLFKAFDMKQTTLITDPENEMYMQPAFTSTKVVVTHNYTKELIDHILKALTIAFG